MLKPLLAFGATRLAFLVAWEPLSPNRTRGEHWGVLHKSRKRATGAWKDALLENQRGRNLLLSLRSRLSDSTHFDGADSCSTPTTTSRAP